MSEIDHEFTAEIVCPWCGYSHRDSFEWGGFSDDGWDNCEECGKAFTWERERSVTYSTERKEAAGDE